MSSTVDQLGRVTQLLPNGGEARPGQQQMAEKIADSLVDHTPALIEAGTGTGKSLAYLTPIIARGQRAVVATATIALQSQLVEKDVPLVAEALERPVSAAVLKGRNNYLCQQRLEELDRANHREQLDLLRGSNPDGHLDRLRDWAEETTTGDKEELDPAPPNDVWSAVSVGGDECPGAARCPAGERCWSEQARNSAREADVIVTNHHYYGLHIAAGGELLPEHDVVVFDEAHHLPAVLGAMCGSEVGGGRFRAVGRRVRNVLTDNDLAIALDSTSSALDRLLREHLGRTIRIEDELLGALVQGRDRVDKVLSALRKAAPTEGSDAAARVERATMAATGLVDTIDDVLSSGQDDVLWVDGTDNSPILRRTPLDVGPLLQERLWDERTVVLTSATMPGALPGELGLDESVDVERVGSPFDYPKLGLLYCAAHLPDPRSAGSPSVADGPKPMHQELQTLITAAGGRTLGLFTSYRAMTEASEFLREATDFPILMQGESSKSALIESFMTEERSVLLATMSFWQGVDLPGSTLTLVTIDKLPFPRPDEPVLQARRRKAGPSAFRQIDLPRAQILLAQAAGRLVRRNDDRGVVAVLDARLANNKSYRWDLINALPPLRRTKDREEVVRFLEELDRSSSSVG